MSGRMPGRVSGRAACRTTMRRARGASITGDTPFAARRTPGRTPHCNVAYVNPGRIGRPAAHRRMSRWAGPCCEGVVAMAWGRPGWLGGVLCGRVAWSAFRAGRRAPRSRCPQTVAVSSSGWLTSTAVRRLKFATRNPVPHIRYAPSPPGCPRTPRSSPPASRQPTGEKVPAPGLPRRTNRLRLSRGRGPSFPLPVNRFPQRRPYGGTGVHLLGRVSARALGG